MMRVTLIGSGRVATHLGTVLEDKGVVIEEVYSRNKKNAKKLAKKFYDARPTDQLDFSDSIAEIFIIAVADNAIQEVADTIKLPNHKAILVHTSGATPLEVLSGSTLYTGVFYPLQTFSFGKKIKFSEVPICIDATAKTALDQLAQLAEVITPKVFHLNSEERKRLHIAAVFACNFTNYLLEVSSQIIETSGLSFQELQPLVQETIDKAFSLPSPIDGQTGPAVRHDHKTIKRHLDVLSLESDEYKYLYEHFTDILQNKKGQYVNAEMIKKLHELEEQKDLQAQLNDMGDTLSQEDEDYLDLEE
ncbi:Rossmann-like and DUF2520 domain-containing protein [Flammeovirga sp. EKP202]|uniref:Rossmann-like and DUF2520 domain-containing protein n=1 Tax=Flammeovirga sp. EKP202 TaxID=2770592 RepID=UPI00165FA1A7|nr:Rossmann-like and DUF2520 domain-containing protein [Flammeovirga sp. EKP202]MBD0402261.1 DUF2520 domain-containing protein [Flammeovirga sp. EKP202]